VLNWIRGTVLESSRSQWQLYPQLGTVLYIPRSSQTPMPRVSPMSARTSREETAQQEIDSEISWDCTACTACTASIMGILTLASSRGVEASNQRGRERVSQRFVPFLVAVPTHAKLPADQYSTSRYYHVLHGVRSRVMAAETERGDGRLLLYGMSNTVPPRGAINTSLSSPGRRDPM
jgi:hypothetical protein